MHDDLSLGSVRWSALHRDHKAIDCYGHRSTGLIAAHGAGLGSLKLTRARSWRGKLVAHTGNREVRTWVDAVGMLLKT